jgi:hypothetical protein
MVGAETDCGECRVVVAVSKQTTQVETLSAAKQRRCYCVWRELSRLVVEMGAADKGSAGWQNFDVCKELCVLGETGACKPFDGVFRASKL